jgi:hypothetical protein
MWFKKKQPASLMSREEALNYRPVKHPLVTDTTLESGVVVITYPIAMRPWATKLMKKLGGLGDRPAMKKLQLDELGTEVWKMLDGNRSVNDVIRIFADTHRLHPKEAEVSITQFIRQLGKRGILGLR